MAVTPDEIKRAVDPLIAKHGPQLAEMASLYTTVMHMAQVHYPVNWESASFAMLRLILPALEKIGKTTEDFSNAVMMVNQTNITLSMLNDLDSKG